LGGAIASVRGSSIDMRIVTNQTIPETRGYHR
jgi:hypothetical protein